MRTKAARQVKRADLHPDVLWAAALRSLPECASSWSAEPSKVAFARSLLEYLTHLVPSEKLPGESLALECLLHAARQPGLSLDEFVEAALESIPSVLRWQIFTYRGSTVYVWDPITGPLASFILASPSLPHIAPAPRVEGASPDPEAFKFLLREKLLLRANTQRIGREAHA